MWPRDNLLRRLGIEHPIIQAPMAGSATPELAAAVSNGGGLGSLGCAMLSPADLRDRVDTLRAATNRPFNLNFFAHRPPIDDPRVTARIRERMAPFYDELGLGEPPATVKAPYHPFNDDSLAVLLEIAPPVVSFHFGVPAPAAMSALKDAGAAILCSATTVGEAIALERLGVDAVIAQGWEAGGHRGAFDVTYEDEGIGTMALVPQVVDAVSVPVIAAGGIADGRGIAAAFALGASGVQLGTAFLSCPEAQLTDAHRAALTNARDTDTCLTRAFSGRPARARVNRYIEAMGAPREPIADFPLMHIFSEPLRQHAIANGKPDFQFLLYGQAAALNRPLPAGDLVRTLIEETRGVFAGQRV